MTFRDQITIPELAEKLGMSRVAVWHKVKKGQIPARKVGRQYVIAARDAEVLLGDRLTRSQNNWIEAAVKQVVDDYGSVLKKLSCE